MILGHRLQEIFNSWVHTKEDKDYYDDFIKNCLNSNELYKKFPLINVIPYQGCLEPGESTLTQFEYAPLLNTEINIFAICNIHGGEEERITVKGCSKLISYYIDTSSVDIGRINFYESSEYKIHISNTGQGEFTFNVSKDTMLDGWLIVEPEESKLFPNETLPLLIKCFPGAVGFFKSAFQINIDYLDPIHITVTGTGVYPQLFFSLPRPKLCDLKPDITYTAIAGLENEPTSCECVQSIFPSADQKILEAYDWVLVDFSKDFYPCIMEIELSIERAWAKNFFLKNIPISDALVAGETFWPIPHFIVAPYIFNLECVPIQTKNKYTLTYVNCGPDKTAVKLATNSNFEKCGFSITIYKQVLEFNQLYDLDVTFFPTVDKYPKLNTNVSTYIYLDIRNGPRIPLQLQAVVATPTVKVSESAIDFGTIRCGNCLRKTFNIINK